MMSRHRIVNQKFSNWEAELKLDRLDSLKFDRLKLDKFDRLKVDK